MRVLPRTISPAASVFRTLGGGRWATIPGPMSGFRTLRARWFLAEAANTCSSGAGSRAAGMDLWTGVPAGVPGDPAPVAPIDDAALSRARPQPPHPLGWLGLRPTHPHGLRLDRLDWEERAFRSAAVRLSRYELPRSGRTREVGRPSDAEMPSAGSWGPLRQPRVLPLSLGRSPGTLLGRRMVLGREPRTRVRVARTSDLADQGRRGVHPTWIRKIRKTLQTSGGSAFCNSCVQAQSLPPPSIDLVGFR